ncbi:hypothetical protein HPB49_003818 [Dermacentor silvarum]|uniref:Uncharacterized protein n=1 Tax=Dermacentor silvarum TaxID=543639 RepID=A0ACB8DMS3_DERSI|nr:hypothetical protein HPB49_003818 [Dermacentor silvarum]
MAAVSSVQSRLDDFHSRVDRLDKAMQLQSTKNDTVLGLAETQTAGSAEVVRTPADYILHAAQQNVWRVSVNLPPFWTDPPEVWFAQVEVQLSLARIPQDRTHQNYVVTHLDARYANELRVILANPPTANLYEHLKNELIDRLSLSEDQKVRQLQPAELAERKPSQLLRHMRALVGNMEVPDSLLQALWLQGLPPHVHTILQDQLTLPLDQLAGVANRVIEVSLPQLSPTVQTVAATPNTTELERRIDDINRQLSSIQRRLDQHSPTHHSQSRGRNTVPSQQPGDDDRCYYHRRFGDRARQSRSPCSAGHKGNAKGSS